MRIHFISNSLRMNSGFSNVTRYIATGLRKLGHDISMTGLQTAYLPEYSYGIECLPIDTVFVDETTQVMLNIQKTNPDIVFCVHQADADMNYLFKLFPKTIIYCPVEGQNIHDGMANDLRSIEKSGGVVVAQCKYGQEEMKKVGINAKCIYHGYNDKIFRPLDLNKDTKYCYYSTEVGQISTDPFILHRQGCYNCNSIKNQEYHQECPYFKEEIIAVLKWIDNKWVQKDIEIGKLKDEFKGRFIYLFVGQNFGLRKRIERLLKAYSILISESRQMKDSTILHLHTMPISIKGINLIKVIQDLGINNNISFSYGSFRSSSWTEQAMSILYNLSDVNVSASSSEGYGLPTLESMACGIPNIGPDCSSFTELIGNSEDKKPRGLLAKIGEWQMIQDQSIRALVNERDLTNQMKIMYTKKDDRKIYSKNAVEWSKQYTWDKIVDQWNNLLKEWHK